MVAPTTKGYSARVNLELWIGSERMALAQIGGGQMKFDREVVLPGTKGEVVATIDDNVRRWCVTWQASTVPQRTWFAEFRDMPEDVASHSPTSASLTSRRDHGPEAG